MRAHSDCWGVAQNTNQHFIKGDDRRISVLGMAPIIEVRASAVFMPRCACSLYLCLLPSQHPIEEEVYDESLFETDRDLRAVRKWFSADFRRTFAEGVEAYRKGDWHTARRLLETTLTDPTLPTRDGDGPSRTLLEYMSRFKYKAPRSWAGNRALTSK